MGSAKALGSVAVGGVSFKACVGTGQG